jgi:large subunit ribosomal protein L10
MENPRPEKVAVVNEVREKLSSSDGAILTEYRGLNVTELADLRRSLRAAGGQYRIY